jgi:hypothetical protein
MALAARSPAELRTACPVCGGSIHPIAGKCKHCKTDLVKLRKAQQVVSATPPPARLPYGGAIARPPTAPVVPLPPTNGAPVPVASAYSAPIAAPPPPNFAAPVPMAPAPVIISAPMPMPAVEPYTLPSSSRGAWSRSWPIVVAVIAAGAIVVSVILLLTGGKPKDKKIDHTDLSPAPDRMNTDPLPTNPDPWQSANPSGNIPSAPAPDPQPAVPAAPAAPAAVAAITTAPAPEEFTVAQWRAVCSRVQSCTGLDPQVKDFCDTFARAGALAGDGVKDHIARGECTYDRDKAVSCLNTLNSIPCNPGQNVDIDKLSQLIAGASDCGSVLTGTCQ